MRRFLRIKRPTVNARVVSGRNAPELECTADDREEAEIVTAVVAAAPEGVTVVGLNEQVVPVGSPEQAKLTVELNPYCGVTVSVAVPEVLELIVSELGETPRVKFAGGGLETWRETGVVS